MHIHTKESISAFNFEQIIASNSIILADLDGTVLPLLPDPSQRFIDAAANDAFTRFNALTPGQIILITGRDWEQVTQCFRYTGPSFPVISSNGAQLHGPGQEEVVTYPFTLPERAFIREMRQTMSDFGAKNPQLVTEVKRFEIGYHSNPAKGYGDYPRDKITDLADRCGVLMDGLANKAREEKLNFAVHGVKGAGRHISHLGIDKLLAIQDFFATHMPPALRNEKWDNVIYFGDRLMKGNDRVIASEVKHRGGRILQVINDKPEDIPPQNDPAYPDLVFNDPAILGAFLADQVTMLERKAVSRLAHRPATHHLPPETHPHAP